MTRNWEAAPADELREALVMAARWARPGVPGMLEELPDLLSAAAARIESDQQYDRPTVILTVGGKDAVSYIIDGRNEGGAPGFPWNKFEHRILATLLQYSLERLQDLAARDGGDDVVP